MRRTLPSQLFRPEQYGGVSGRVTGINQGGVAAELLRVLTLVPGCLEEFWSTIEPAFTAGLIQEAANEVRTTASLVMRDAVHFPDHLQWLGEQGCSREDNRQIRYIVETYFHTEPCQAVLAAIAYRWILGLSSSTLAVKVTRSDGLTSHRLLSAFEVVGEDESPPCLASVEKRMGKPAHSFFRALALWPGYLHNAWSDLDSLRCEMIYPAMVSDIKQSIDDVSRRIPICRDSSVIGFSSYNIASYIQQCIDHSCEVILSVAALRRMFIRAETIARNRRIKASLDSKIS